MSIEINDAAELGADAGKAAGSWALDGSTSAETLRQCLALDADGDPAWHDLFGPMSGPLSGEYADEPTPSWLMWKLGLDDAGEEVENAVCTAYEDAFYDGWHYEVIRTARKLLHG